MKTKKKSFFLKMVVGFCGWFKTTIHSPLPTFLLLVSYLIIEKEASTASKTIYHLTLFNNRTIFFFSPE
jgi:hypothetical protein